MLAVGRARSDNGYGFEYAGIREYNEHPENPYSPENVRRMWANHKPWTLHETNNMLYQQKQWEERHQNKQ
jgi:hypothetical protein